MVNFLGLLIVDLHELDADPSSLVVIDRYTSSLFHGYGRGYELSANRIAQVIPETHVRLVDVG
ncbi:MAG: hypothetical protein V3S55_07750 [Nitrospiraceae bacterium]